MAIGFIYSRIGAFAVELRNNFNYKFSERQQAFNDYIEKGKKYRHEYISQEVGKPDKSNQAEIDSDKKEDDPSSIYYKPYSIQ